MKNDKWKTVLAGLGIAGLVAGAGLAGNAAEANPSRADVVAGPTGCGGGSKPEAEKDKSNDKEKADDKAKSGDESKDKAKGGSSCGHGSCGKGSCG